MRSFHTPTQKNPTQLRPNSPIFYPHPQTLNFPLFFNENHISPKNHPLSNPLSSNPLFHNTFPPFLTQNSSKIFHKFTLPSQLSSLYKGIFTMYYFYVKNHHSTPNQKFSNLSTENNNISHKIKNKETVLWQQTNQQQLKIYHFK